MLPGYAWPSATSEMYRTLALVELDEQRYSAALELLESAVEADAGDPHSRYYRGLVYSRLGRYREALPDIAQVDPVLYPQQHFELGYVHYRLGRLEAAGEALRQSVTILPQHAAAHYYLGLLSYKLGDFDTVLTQLEKASSLDQAYGPSADYLRADSLQKLGRKDEARELLRSAMVVHADSVYAGEMSDLLTALDKAEKDARARRYELSLSAGIAYDNNVGLFADEQSLPEDIDSGADNRLQLALDARALVRQREGESIKLGYRFFASHHDMLHDYDVVNHSLIGSYRQATGWGNLTLQYHYRLAYLGGDEYNQSHVLLPGLAVIHNENRFSQLQLQLRQTGYSDEALADREGGYYELDYRHFWAKGNAEHHYLGGRLGEETSQASAYDFYGMRAGLQRRYASWRISGGALFEHRVYGNSVPQRKDNQLELNLGLGRSLCRDLRLNVGLTYIMHPSSWAGYDYERGVASVAVRWQP